MRSAASRLRGRGRASVDRHIDAMSAFNFNLLKMRSYVVT